MKLGDVIVQVDERNRDESAETLLGVAIEKRFMPSVANVIGTDLSGYKVVRKNRFACNPMHVGRDEKLPIARYNEDASAIVSPAYFTFEVSSSKVMPEYLELWFARDEFDRRCWFATDASVRGGLAWDALCDIDIDIPPLEEQEKTVERFNAINTRIATLQQLNDKLVAAGICIVNEAASGLSLAGMTSRDVEAIAIPDSCSSMMIASYCAATKSGSTPNRAISEYWCNPTIPWLKSGEVDNNITVETEESITALAVAQTSTKLLPKNTVLMAMYGVTAGKVGYLDIPACTNQAICGLICEDVEHSAYLYFSLLRDQEVIKRLSNGGAQSNLSKEIIDNTWILVPKDFHKTGGWVATILNAFRKNYEELSLEKETRNVLLARLG